jgi:integrase
MLKEDNRRDRSLTDKRIDILLDSCIGKLVKLYVLIALDTGLRKGSIFRLRKSDLDFEKRIIATKKTKGGKFVLKPMTERVYQALKTHVETWPHEYLFYNPRTGKPFRVDASKGFQSACKRAGMKRWRFQDLKHVFVNRLFDSGADSVTVRDLADHASLTTTNLYASSRADQRRKAIEKLNK